MEHPAKKHIDELRERLDKIENMIDNNQRGADVLAMFAQRSCERIAKSVTRMPIEQQR